MTKVTLKLNKASITSTVGGATTDACRRAATISEQRMKANITGAGRVDTGKMRDSVRSVKTPASKPMRPVFRVEVPVAYAKWQNAGRGWVYPIRAKMLRFVIAGRVIFAKRARPAPGAHFLEKTLAEVRPSDFTG